MTEVQIVIRLLVIGQRRFAILFVVKTDGNVIIKAVLHKAVVQRLRQFQAFQEIIERRNIVMDIAVVNP